jgi:hypothetical protein
MTWFEVVTKADASQRSQAFRQINTKIKMTTLDRQTGRST